METSFRIGESQNESKTSNLKLSKRKINEKRIEKNIYYNLSSIVIMKGDLNAKSVKYFKAALQKGKKMTIFQHNLQLEEC